MEATNDWLIVEIDIKENNHLVEDLGRKFFIKRINQRRVEKKVRHGYILENLFVTFKVLYFYIMEVVPQKIKKLEYMTAKKKANFIMYLIYHISLHIAK